MAGGRDTNGAGAGGIAREQPVDATPSMPAGPQGSSASGEGRHVETEVLNLRLAPPPEMSAVAAFIDAMRGSPAVLDIGMHLDEAGIPRVRIEARDGGAAMTALLRLTWPAILDLIVGSDGEFTARLEPAAMPGPTPPAGTTVENGTGPPLQPAQVEQVTRSSAPTLGRKSETLRSAIAGIIASEQAVDTGAGDALPASPASDGATPASGDAGGTAEGTAAAGAEPRSAPAHESTAAPIPGRAGMRRDADSWADADAAVGAGGLPGVGTARDSAPSRTAHRDSAGVSASASTRASAGGGPPPAAAVATAHVPSRGVRSGAHDDWRAIVLAACFLPLGALALFLAATAVATRGRWTGAERPSVAAPLGSGDVAAPPRATAVGQATPAATGRQASASATVAATVTSVPTPALALPPVPPPAPGEPPRSYTVRPGDTLPAIAAYFGARIEAVISANNLPADGRLEPGQVLIVPQSP